MRIVEVPVLSDNYAYLLIDDEAQVAGAVDPAEPTKVLAAAKAQGVSIKSVLTTHHHWDHAGGNEEMKKLLPSVEIFGGDDRIGALSKKVQDQETFKVGSLEVKVFFTPCHTSGHVLYFVTDPRHPSEPPALFSGDTLFLAGCGRFFEGTAEQMYHALIDVVSNLPGNTRVYCGHEYSVQNLLFARSVEPNNQKALDKLEWAKQQRAQDRPTIPSTIAEELEYNPFMRVRDSKLQASVSTQDPIQTMAQLRSLKNSFKG